jgi:hypothetical protein
MHDLVLVGYCFPDREETDGFVHKRHSNFLVVQKKCTGKMSATEGDVASPHSVNQNVMQHRANCPSVQQENT